jgi:hypothetical protein
MRKCGVKGKGPAKGDSFHLLSQHGNIPHFDADKEKLHPGKIKELLHEYGTQVSLEEAQLILEFMSHWAKIVLKQYLVK